MEGSTGDRHPFSEIHCRLQPLVFAHVVQLAQIDLKLWLHSVAGDGQPRFTILVALTPGFDGFNGWTAIALNRGFEAVVHTGIQGWQGLWVGEIQPV